MLITFQINDDFLKSYHMHYVISCVICMSNNVEYLEKEASYKNSPRGYIVILRDLCNAIKKVRQNFVAYWHFNLLNCGLDDIRGGVNDF